MDTEGVELKSAEVALEWKQLVTTVKSKLQMKDIKQKTMTGSLTTKTYKQNKKQKTI